jgi:tartronate-semialdehyde synthase
VALSGDYDFQFMIEELAVGAQHKLPYLHVVVNNSYLGLIRQAQRGFEMDFEVSLAFENINATPEGDAVPGYGVDHVRVAEALGCKAIRIKTPEAFKAAFARAKELMEQHRVPVVLEFILERVTNISMGTEITDVNEFEEILCLDPSLSIRKGQDMRAAERTKEADALVEKR